RDGSANSDTGQESATGGSRRSSSARKPKKNQIPIGLAVLAGMIIFTIYLAVTVSGQLALYFVVGSAFGMILQRARFCFTASMRDPYLTGSTSVTRAALVAFAITSIGFTAIKYGYFRVGLPIPGMGFVAPIGVSTAVGAVIFGIGMVIAGGCASGTLMRVGEGFHMNMLVFFFFMAGSLWGAYDFGFWKRNFMLASPSVFLPDIFGWGGGLLVNLLIIGILYVAADKWEKRKNASSH
ncbi:MAG: YeeE/YedE thiosulfate transporter family protein, partial [Eubacteriales bacterium]|nr:YeeE/YedE thiosulfate transporter family protein [Eubacteriales bacterium]